MRDKPKSGVLPSLTLSLVLVAAILPNLTSCSDMPAPNAEMTTAETPEQATENSANVIGGQINDWRGGHVRAEVMVRNSNNKPQLIASGMVTPYGNVTINLPAKIPTDLLYSLQPSQNCQSRLSVSNAKAGVLNVQDFLLRFEDQILGIVENRTETSKNISEGSSYISRFYSSENVDILGSLQCGLLKENYQKMTLQKGWNIIKTTIEKISDTGQVLEVSYQKPKDQPLEFRVYKAAKAGVMIYAPAQAKLTPNTTVTLPVTLLPANRYYGPVTVRFEGVKGVSVITDKIQIAKPTNNTNSISALDVNLKLSSQLANMNKVISKITIEDTNNDSSDNTGKNTSNSKNKTTDNANLEVPTNLPELQDGLYQGRLIFVTGDTEQRVPLAVEIQGSPKLWGGKTFNLPFAAGQSRPVNINLGNMDLKHPDSQLVVSLLSPIDGISLGNAKLALAATDKQSSILTNLTVAPDMPAGEYQIRLATTYQGLLIHSRPIKITVLPPQLAISLQRTPAPTQVIADALALSYQLEAQANSAFAGKIKISMQPNDADAFLGVDKDKEITLAANERKTIPLTIRIPKQKHFLSSFTVTIQVFDKNGQELIDFAEVQNVPVVHLPN